jgi:hypothetical protein
MVLEWLMSLRMEKESAIGMRGSAWVCMRPGVYTLGRLTGLGPCWLSRCFVTLASCSANQHFSQIRHANGVSFVSPSRSISG